MVMSGEVLYTSLNSLKVSNLKYDSVQLVSDILTDSCRLKWDGYTVRQWTFFLLFCCYYKNHMVLNSAFDI